MEQEGRGASWENETADTTMETETRRLALPGHLYLLVPWVMKYADN
jgi:hypothetical protein